MLSFTPSPLKRYASLLPVFHRHSPTALEKGWVAQPRGSKSHMRDGQSASPASISLCQASSHKRTKGLASGGSSSWLGRQEKSTNDTKPLCDHLKGSRKVSDAL